MRDHVGEQQADDRELGEAGAQHDQVASIETGDHRRTVHMADIQVREDRGEGMDGLTIPGATIRRHPAFGVNENWVNGWR